MCFGLDTCIHRYVTDQDAADEGELQQGGHDVEHEGGEDEADAPGPAVYCLAQRAGLPVQMEPCGGANICTNSAPSPPHRRQQTCRPCVAMLYNTHFSLYKALW